MPASFSVVPNFRHGKLQSPRLCTRASKTAHAFCAVFVLQHGVARSRAHCFPRSTKMQVQVQSCAATARLAWRLRLHSCLCLSELRGSSCILCAPFQQTVVRVPWSRGEEIVWSTPLAWCLLALCLAPLASPTSPLRTAQQPQPQLGPPASRCSLRQWFRDARRSSQVSEKKKSVTLRIGWRQYL